jgi:outer membrane protein assembly factor BamE (lipoprotein component of BamABCDE complex)
MFFSFKYHINKILLLSFLILVNCQLQQPLKTHGIIYLENRAKKLELNTSNKNDVIKILGQPQVKDEDNENTWIYFERILTKGNYHKLGQHVLKENNILVLSFDKYGVLNELNFLDKENINKIAFSEKETTNELAQKSFVEKFLQSIRQKMYRNRK